MVCDMETDPIRFAAQFWMIYVHITCEVFFSIRSLQETLNTNKNSVFGG